jgi:hypothetical protein
VTRPDVRRRVATRSLIHHAHRERWARHPLGRRGRLGARCLRKSPSAPTRTARRRGMLGVRENPTENPTACRKFRNHSKLLLGTEFFSPLLCEGRGHGTHFCLLRTRSSFSVVRLN